MRSTLDFIRPKERPGEVVAPGAVYGYRPYLLSLSAAWASAMFGYDSAFIGGTLTLPSFQKSYGLADADKTTKSDLSSNIVSTFQAGAFFGAIFGYFVAEKFGRRSVLYVSAAVFVIGVVLQMIGHLSLLYAGRALTGLGIGASTMDLPIYIGECAPALIRGRLIGLFEIMLQIALVFGFWVNYGVNKNISPNSAEQWRIPVGVQFIPAGLLVICLFFFSVESPRWLVSKGRTEEAKKALAWLRHLPEDHFYVRHELLKMEIGVSHEIETAGGGNLHLSIARELFGRGVRNRLFLGTSLMVLQNMTGINAINYYSPTIFKSIGFTGTSVGLLATGVYGLVKMFVTLIFMLFFVDTVGRRPALLVGAVGAAFAMYYLGIYAALSDSIHHAPPKDAGANAAVAMVYIYAIFYAFSWNGIPWIFTSEVLPTRTRTMGMAIGTCVQWLSQFIVVYSLPHMIEGISYGTFLFFGSCTVCAFIFAFLFIPETKGIPIEDMDLIFGQGVSVLARKATRNYLDLRQEREAELMERVEDLEIVKSAEKDRAGTMEVMVEHV